ncbi:hypothetical protein HRbin40_00514 [bacterium HR40]|nr:hypothetical protein HRbin40_00514 [bacterium HR40]
MDVDLAPRTDDRSDLAILDRTLAEVLPAARPDLVLDIAGSEPRQDDHLGRLALAMRGSVRALRVFAARRHSRLPVVRVAGGGYGGIEKAAARRTPLFRALAAPVNVARGRRSCPG